MTYSEYLRATRFKYAISLFELGISSIKNVALLAGFSDPFYFSNAFKKTIGVSPREFILKMAKNKEKLHNLMLLGYSPTQVARNYYLMIGIVNCIVLLVSIGVLTIASSLWSTPLENLGLKGAPMWGSIIVGSLIMIVVTLSCFVIISRNVKKNF